MSKTASLCAVAVLSCSLWGQTQPHPASESELAETAARGLALTEYDAAAWHASDALMLLHPETNTLQRYVARKVDGVWVVAWGRFNDARTKFLIAYEARQKGDSNDYTVTKHDPPLADSDAYFHGARANQLATEAFLREAKPQRQYNISVLPGVAGEWYVYAIPAQTDLAVLPYGGDVRYLISADGTKILEKRQMHKTVLEENIGTHPEFGFHTHVLSDIPEDSDVFYALTRKAAHGEWIGTKDYFYEIRLPGSLKYLGTTAEIVKRLRDNNMTTLDESSKAMVLSSAQRLLEGAFSSNPLEAFTSFSGARCTDGTLWLKFAITLHNIGEQKIILYKDPVRNSQGRFGATETEILSGKFEKLSFFNLEKTDFSDKNSYIMLSPGMAYSREREYPIPDLDLNGKAAVQFLFFTWPIGDEREVDPQRSRWEGTGYLYADTITALPAQIKVDTALLKGCPAKK